MAEGSFRYRVGYELVLDSGLRLEGACRFINAFVRAPVEKFDGFFVASLGYFRRSKLAYSAFLIDETFTLLGQLEEKVDHINA